MINGVNQFSVNNTSNRIGVQNSSMQFQACAKPAFGDYYQSDSQSGPLQGLKDLAVAITNDFIGFVGVNAALGALQKVVNGDILIGKINEHFTKGIEQADKEKLATLASVMKEEKGLQNVNLYTGKTGEAFYTHLGNHVVVGPDKHSALFHELGHAFEENKTHAFKTLQRGRGNYAWLSLALYTLLGQNGDNNGGLTTAIPMLAFAPELITEAKASIEGLKFLKTKVNKEGQPFRPENISLKTFKSIKRSYLTCFGTYLFIPISIMLVEAIRHSADKALQRRKMQKEQMYF